MDCERLVHFAEEVAILLSERMERSAMVPVLCFVLMPFGSKHDPGGGPDIDFDRIYDSAIEPGIRAAGLEPVRADHEMTGGIIHKPMFERLLLCEYAVADLTTANPNVFYELGVRHAVRPRTTLPIFAKGHPIPFDVAMLRALPYSLGGNNAFADAEASALRDSIAARLEELRDAAHDLAAPDSPVVQLVDGYACPDLAHLRTDLVRERLKGSAALQRELRRARALKPNEAAKRLQEIEAELGNLHDVEAGTLVDLYLSYRAVDAHRQMVALYDRMPRELQGSVLVREQRAFALNRLARKAPPEEREMLRADAIDLLKEVLAERGPNAETCGLLGRVFKDRWEEVAETHPAEAGDLLDDALDAYTRGFAADWRDAYPGINAATLLEVQGSDQSLAEQEMLLPVVRFAAEQRAKRTNSDYWDHATLVEVAVLMNLREETLTHLGRALTRVAEAWQPETTARNLGLILKTRAARGGDVAWIQGIIGTLEQKAADLRKASR